MPMEKRGGRRVWRWTEEEHRMVEALAEAGLPAARVARALDCHPDVLLRRYPAEMFDKGKRGGKPTHYTPEQRELVESMAGFGIPVEDIAKVIGCGPEALYAEFAVELATAAPKANARVAGFLFNQAKNGSTSAAIFWLKVRAGWKETTHVEMTHGGGIDLAVASSLDVLTTDELVELRSMAKRAALRAAPTAESESA